MTCTFEALSWLVEYRTHVPICFDYRLESALGCRHPTDVRWLTCGEEGEEVGDEEDEDDDEEDEADVNDEEKRRRR